MKLKKIQMNDLSVLRDSFIQNYTTKFMKIDIPLPCPSCGGKMYSISYESKFPILNKRSWQICKECSFERDSEDFKKSICCA